MILGIDTSLGTTVAVIELDGVVRAEVESTDPRGHAEVIGSLIQRALAEASATPKDVTHVAVGMGPGPFTGLRVGIAAARAFALGLDVPVIPVVSHDAVALGILLGDAVRGADTARFAVVTDARRREFACTVYDGLDDDGLPIREAEPQLVPREDAEVLLAGLGAQRADAASVPASMIALVAARSAAAGRTTASHDVLYLRSPDVTLASAPKRVSA